jgi:hypothetical protein
VVYRFRLLSPDGEDLGPFVSTSREWRAGETLPHKPGVVLRVTAVVEPEGGATFRAYLVVEETPQLN